MAPYDARTISGVFAERYTVERELGRGGSAVVYLARDQRHGTPVAIKVLRQEIAVTIGAERFLREIRLSEGLHHPNILPILDSGEQNGALYFALPFADGGTLRERLASQRQLPLQEAIAIAGTVASALDHAHGKGLIHRDVKPENILFSNGSACLADFGIARALEHSAAESTTSSGIVRGTPAYMSPEQASGEARLDGRSDLYSLGCVVYEMLSGMMPFDGPSSQSIIAMRFTHAPRPLRQFRPSLPMAIEAVMTRAMAVAPADRYQTGAEFIDALETASRASDPIITPPETPRYRRSRPWIIGTGVVAIAAAALVIAKAATPPTGIPDGDPRRVAVMYFDDLTPAVLPAHVVDGLTEDLIDQLGATSALQVVSTFGTRPFRGTAVGVDSVRRALQVGTIITGNVASVGDSVRVTARLVDAATGQQVVTVPLSAAASDLLGLRSQLVERIAFSLRQRIGERIALRESRAMTKSEPAWEAVQLAANLMQRGVASATSAPFKEADSLYARAAQLDPSWALPWVGRGLAAQRLATSRRDGPPSLDSLTYWSLPGSEQRSAWYVHALPFADSALRRDPRSWRALALRGDLRQSLANERTDGADSLRRLAERDLREALAINPNAAAAWTALSRSLMAQGRYGDAAEAAQRGYDADPFFESRQTLNRAFFTSLYAGAFDNAQKWCTLGLDHYATDARFTECKLTLLGWSGRSAVALKEAQRALVAIEQADTLGLVATTWGYRRTMVAAVAARAGFADTARALIAQIHSARVPDSLRTNIELGESYVMLLLGKRDSSFAILQRFATTPARRKSIALHPWFFDVREDPRFLAIVTAR